MKLSIRSRGFVASQDLRTESEQRVGAALSRFVHAIRRVELTLADVNGPRGGIDKVARLRVSGRGFPPLLIEQKDSDIGRAVAFAVDRASRTLARALERTRGLLMPDREGV
jgi:putative sigma-54 modulation protein